MQPSRLEPNTLALCVIFKPGTDMPLFSATRHAFDPCSAGGATARACLALLGAITAGCEADQCKAEEVLCEGTVAAACISLGGSKTSASHLEWKRVDCAKQAAVCVVDGGAVACVKSSKPCDDKLFAASCSKNVAARCAPVEGVNWRTTKQPFEIAEDCKLGSCVIDGGKATCISGAPGPACSKPETVACEPGNVIVYCTKDGVSFPEKTCDKQESETCVALQSEAFCAGSATPCSEPGATKCSATGRKILTCAAPVVGNPALYWMRTGSCLSSEPCVVKDAKAVCQP